MKFLSFFFKYINLWMGWGGRREGGSGWGTHVNPWLIHVNVWQKPLQYCKVISLQLIKINGKKYKNKTNNHKVAKKKYINVILVKEDNTSYMCMFVRKRRYTSYCYMLGAFNFSSLVLST